MLTELNKISYDTGKPHKREEPDETMARIISDQEKTIHEIEPLLQIEPIMFNNLAQNLKVQLDIYGKIHEDMMRVDSLQREEIKKLKKEIDFLNGSLFVFFLKLP